MATNGKHKSLSRHDSVLLNRLCIGHIRLMHCYLLSGDDISECSACQCPLTVEHILMECVDFNDVQNKHFVASSIKDLFKNVEPQNIIDFCHAMRCISTAYAVHAVSV